MEYKGEEHHIKNSPLVTNAQNTFYEQMSILFTKRERITFSLSLSLVLLLSLLEFTIDLSELFVIVLPI